MQAIITKYLPATNFKASRIKASCERGSITISYPHEAGMGEAAHAVAAQALVAKFLAEDLKRNPNGKDSYNPWSAPRVIGAHPLLPACYIHCFVPRWQKYSWRFWGKKKGAMGKSNLVEIATQGRDFKEAQQAIYVTHEHVERLTLTDLQFA